MDASDEQIAEALAEQPMDHFDGQPDFHDASGDELDSEVRRAEPRKDLTGLGIAAKTAGMVRNQLTKRGGVESAARSAFR